MGAEGKAKRFPQRGSVPTSTHQPKRLVGSPAGMGRGWELRLQLQWIPGRGLGLAAWTQPEGASAPQLAGRESGKKSGAAEEARDFFLPLCLLVREKRGLRELLKGAPETGVRRGYQRGPQRWAWDAKAAAAATKNPVSKHRSLCTPPLPGACAAHHCQGPVIQGQLPRENTRRASRWCNVMPASAATGSPHIPYPSLPLAWVSQSPQISCSFNPVLSERRTDALRQPTCRDGSKSKAEPQELCKQRREREISPSSLRSCILNLHNQLDVPCICGIPE